MIDHAQTKSSSGAGRRARPKPERSCVGCGKRASPEELVRLVVSPEGQVAVDLAGGSFGRGAHVHPSLACLERAPKGLARSFRRAIEVRAAELARNIARAGEMRAWGLLSSAVRSRCAAIGSDPVQAALEGDSTHLVVVARDAAAAAGLSGVSRAVAEGRAIAFGTKETLGALAGKAEVAVLAITSPRLANALQHVVRIVRGVAPANQESETQETRPFQNAGAAEDR